MGLSGDVNNLSLPSMTKSAIKELLFEEFEFKYINLNQITLKNRWLFEFESKIIWIRLNSFQMINLNRVGYLSEKKTS